MPDKQNDATRLCELSLTQCISILLCCCAIYSCTPKQAITPKGIKIARLGKKMPAPASTYAGFATRDSLITEAGFEWPVLRVEMQEGHVWIEGDFAGGASINRLRIETPELVYKRKIRVGSSLTALQALRGEWQALYLRSYRSVDIEVGGIHFLVDEEALPQAARGGKEAAIVVDPTLLNLNAKIKSIVVF